MFERSNIVYRSPRSLSCQIPSLCNHVPVPGTGGALVVTRERPQVSSADFDQMRVHVLMTRANAPNAKTLIAGALFPHSLGLNTHAFIATSKTKVMNLSDAGDGCRVTPQ